MQRTFSEVFVYTLGQNVLLAFYLQYKIYWHIYFYFDTYNSVFVFNLVYFTPKYVVFLIVFLLSRIAKKMLLEEIKANLSSDEDGSSDDESEEGKKRTGKQNEENTGDEGELPKEKCRMS